jgi:hypothetical protein
VKLLKMGKLKTKKSDGSRFFCAPERSCKRKGLSQMDLVFKCGDKDYSQINRVELGKVNFSVSYLSLIADALGVSPEVL